MKTHSQFKMASCNPSYLKNMSIAERMVAYLRLIDASMFDIRIQIKKAYPYIATNKEMSPELLINNEFDEKDLSVVLDLLTFITGNMQKQFFFLNLMFEDVDNGDNCGAIIDLLETNGQEKIEQWALETLVNSENSVTKALREEFELNDEFDEEIGELWDLYFKLDSDVFTELKEVGVTGYFEFSYDFTQKALELKGYSID